MLVAEDDVALRRLLELRLTVDGFQARSVCDGSEVIGEVEAWAPDLLICDVMMPQVNGLSVCQQLRSLGSELPVILLTARCMDTDIEAVLSLGGITFMNKPFNAAALKDTLEQILRVRTRPESPATRSATQIPS